MEEALDIGNPEKIFTLIYLDLVGFTPGRIKPPASAPALSSAKPPASAPALSRIGLQLGKALAVVL
jgi:hypothetical protein